MMGRSGRIGSEQYAWPRVACRRNAAGVAVAATECLRVGGPHHFVRSNVATHARHAVPQNLPRVCTQTHTERTSMQVDKAVQALREHSSAPATMLSHSAGGWLARLYLQDFGTDGFDRLVSLGSPHRPPPEGAKGIVDQTRGILKFCEDNCPGAFHGEVRLRECRQPSAGSTV